MPPPPENPGHASLANDSEFKQYFGVTEKLEGIKQLNDTSLNMSTHRFSKLSGIYTSAIMALFLVFAYKVDRERAKYILYTYPSLNLKRMLYPSSICKPDCLMKRL